MPFHIFGTHYMPISGQTRREERHQGPFSVGAFCSSKCQALKPASCHCCGSCPWEDRRRSDSNLKARETGARQDHIGGEDTQEVSGNLS